MANKRTKNFPEVVINPEEITDKIDFDSIFGRKAPVHVEIGSGKGTFLVSQTRAFPEINFVGMEWAAKFYRFAVDRLGRWGIKNVRMMRIDAAVFIEEHFPDECVDRYHIYFPDPWHKKRHNKRRLICDENLAQFIRTLKPGGVINIATDHEEYFEQMVEVLNKEIGKSLDQIDYTKPAGAREGEVAGTNFERKYIDEGRIFNTIAVRKK